MDKFPSIKVPKDYGNREEDSLEFKLITEREGVVKKKELTEFEKNERIQAKEKFEL